MRITESQLRKIIREECSCMSGHSEDNMNYHTFEDSDAHEEAGMIKSNLYSISAKAKSLHDIVGDGDDLPEWVQEKIAVADEMIDVIHDYLMYEYDRSK